jgi:hypothetical protein
MVRGDTNHGTGFDSWRHEPRRGVFKITLQKKPRLGVGAKLIVNLDVINVLDPHHIRAHLCDRMVLPSAHQLF